MLSYVKADIFAIFDCCNAGRLCHTRGPALWEVLGACSEGQTTEPPSDESFTRALIWALQQLRQKERCRFSTSELRKKIKEAPDLPKHQQPPLKNRTNDSLPHIYIAPYTKEEEATVLMIPPSSETDQADVAQYFDIRLHATVVTDALIERAAELLDQLIEPDSKTHLAVDRISYLGSGSFNRVHRFALSWLERTRVKNNRPSSEHPRNTNNLARPTVRIPDATSVHSKLEVPPQSAISERSVSSNATTFGEGRHEASTLVMENESATENEPSDHQLSIGVKTVIKPAAATVESNALHQFPVSDIETNSPGSQNTPKSSLQDHRKDMESGEGDILAEKKRSRRGGSLSRFLRSKVLGLKSQAA